MGPGNCLMPSLLILSSLTMLFLACLGTNRISYAVQGAHEGGIFALCMLRDGTLVSGGGKDRRLISWNGNYQKLHKTEVNPHEDPAPVCVMSAYGSDQLRV